MGIHIRVHLSRAVRGDKMKITPIYLPQEKTKFAVIDIETANWTRFIVLGYYDGTEYREFKTLKAFFTWLACAQRCETMFAHFGGKFDFLFLLKEALRNEHAEVTAIVPRGSSMLYFTLKIKNKVYTFRDSSALLPFSLKSITENFGVTHVKQEYDHSKTTRYTKELSMYLKYDCIGLYESLEKFYSWPLIEKAGGATTLASQAMRVFRTYLKKDLYGLGDDASAFVRESYLGGRTEIFRPFCKKGPLYEYDVNSLYPFVMRDNYYPVGNGYFTFSFEDHRLGIYKARVRVHSDVHVPCLGVVRDGKFVFPTGEFSGVWTSAELSYARSLGYDIEIIEGYVFPRKEKLFHDFITDLYKIRLTSPKNSVSDILAKLLMNSSYGRFGMNLEKENITFELKEGVKEYRAITMNGKNIQMYSEPVRLRTFTHPGIAAFVTSYARIHMHRLMSKIKPDALYYTDTDSIFTTDELPTGKNLGDLKHEGTYDSAVFLLPKTYYAKGLKKSKIAMKGFDKKKISQFDFDDFHSALEGDLKRFKIENEPKFATLKTAIAQNKIVAMTKKTEKQLRSEYSKRIIVKQNGHYFTKPLTLKEE